MKTLFLIITLCISFTTNAALITTFNHTTNDGVFSITSGQAKTLGVEGADRLGFLRLRQGANTSWDIGDVFDRNAIFSSTTSDNFIFDIFNGFSVLPWNGKVVLSFSTGGLFERFESATILAEDDFYRGIIFAFNSSNTITFNGSSTFSGTANGAISTSFIQEQVDVSAPSTLGIFALVFIFFAKRKMLQRRK